MSEVVLLSSSDEEKGKSKIRETKYGEACKERRRDHGLVNVLATFKKFLVVCHDIEVTKRNGDPKSMTRINDKLLRRFQDADPEYSESVAFKTALRTAEKCVTEDPANLFVHMKQVGDELKLRKLRRKNDNHKRKLRENEDCTTSKRSRIEAEERSGSGDEEMEHSNVNKRHVRKLELIFEKVYRKVKKLEKKEVDWDAEEDSQYLRLERYKKRLYTIWEKWQEVRGRKEEVKKLKYKKIAITGSKYPELDQAIEKFVNRTRCFPDFADIHHITCEILNKDNSFPPDQLKSVAYTAFYALGNQLQKYRVYDFWDSCMSYLPSAPVEESDIIDPAEDNKDLAKALNKNKQEYSKKLSEVINSFVERQEVNTDELGEVHPVTDEKDSTEEEKEEEPEEIVCLDFSSEESTVEDTDVKVQNEKGSSKPNGKIDEMKKRSNFDTSNDCEHLSGETGMLGKVQTNSGESSGRVAVKLEQVSGKMESDSIHLPVPKKRKDGDVLEVVVLSGSDSEE